MFKANYAVEQQGLVGERDEFQALVAILNVKSKFAETNMKHWIAYPYSSPK